MKKLLVTLLALLVSTSAIAGVDLKFTPGVAMPHKLTEAYGFEYDDVSPSFDFEGNYIFDNGFALGADVFFAPGGWKVGKFDGDVNMVGVTFGPKYFYKVEKLRLFAGVGFGYYNTQIDAFGRSYDEDSWGVNGSVGFDYNVWKSMTLGLKSTVHYVRDGGFDDDYVVVAVGPTFGLTF